MSTAAAVPDEPAGEDRDSKGPEGFSWATAVPGEKVGIVGSPSSTGEFTFDVVDTAKDRALLGDMVYMSHSLRGGIYQLALASVGEIETRNRWHEDPNMRGVLRVHGYLPHLSADGDVRSAAARVQAVYAADAPNPPFSRPPVEAGGALGMSPTTGQEVRLVDNDLIQDLIARHQGEVVYLGYLYRTSVLLPMYVRAMADPKGIGAYHTGIFGRTGSGKTTFACFLLAAQLKHTAQSIFVFDPQGQFTTQSQFTLDVQRIARQFGRDVQLLSIAEDIQLPPDAPLAIELLDSTRFFPQLSMKSRNLNRQAAVDEMERILRRRRGWSDDAAADVMRGLLEDLVADEAAMTRIYAGNGPRERFATMIATALGDDTEFGELLKQFEPVHSLFTSRKSSGGKRVGLQHLIHTVLEDSDEPKPYVVVDLSSRAGNDWLDSGSTKARLIRKIAGELRRIAEVKWRETKKSLNCMVMFDEAARFASAQPEGDQEALLAGRLVDYIRETRKTGVGWTFITQEIGSLDSRIYTQLTIKAFGYGLTSGSDLNRIRDEIGRGSGLELYMSFPDPRALTEKQYPFMLTGPVSPLSFTSAPVFLEVFTSEEELREANRSPRDHTRRSDDR
jgi:DNA helicase HerA-like ATPase